MGRIAPSWWCAFNWSSNIIKHNISKLRKFTENGDTFGGSKYELITKMINSKKSILVQISAPRGSKGSQHPVNDISEILNLPNLYKTSLDFNQFQYEMFQNCFFCQSTKSHPQIATFCWQISWWWRQGHWQSVPLVPLRAAPRRVVPVVDALKIGEKDRKSAGLNFCLPIFRHDFFDMSVLMLIWFNMLMCFFFWSFVMYICFSFQIVSTTSSLSRRCRPQTNLEGVGLRQILPMPFYAFLHGFTNSLRMFLVPIQDFMLESNALFLTKVPQWIERPQLIKMAQAVLISVLLRSCEVAN